jgi:WD40 repeat protein
VLASGGDGSVGIWRVDTGRRLRTFEPHNTSPDFDSIWAVDLSPDGTLVATTGTYEVARVWDAVPDRVRKDDFEQLEGAPILLDGPTLVVRGHHVTHLRDTVHRP